MCLPNLPEARDVTIIINTIELRFWLFYEDSEDLDKLLSFLSTINADCWPRVHMLLLTYLVLYLLAEIYGLNYWWIWTRLLSQCPSWTCKSTLLTWCFFYDKNKSLRGKEEPAIILVPSPFAVKCLIHLLGSLFAWFTSHNVTMKISRDCISTVISVSNLLNLDCPCFDRFLAHDLGPRSCQWPQNWEFDLCAQDPVCMRQYMHKGDPLSMVGQSCRVLQDLVSNQMDLELDCNSVKHILIGEMGVASSVVNPHTPLTFTIAFCHSFQWFIVCFEL